MVMTEQTPQPAEAEDDAKRCCVCGTDQYVCDASSISDGPICTDCFIEWSDRGFALTGE
jgi:hypothetical protein